MWSKNVTNGKQYIQFNREWTKNSNTQINELTEHRERICNERGFWFIKWWICHDNNWNRVQNSLIQQAQAGKTLDEQLRLINQVEESDVQFQWAGEKVIPKALKVLDNFKLNTSSVFNEITQSL